MFKVYIERTEDCDYIYKRDSYHMARCLANSQRLDFVDFVEITDVDTGKTLYRKRAADDRKSWIVEVSDK